MLGTTATDISTLSTTQHDTSMQSLSELTINSSLTSLPEVFSTQNTSVEQQAFDSALAKIERDMALRNSPAFVLGEWIGRLIGTVRDEKPPVSVKPPAPGLCTNSTSRLSKIGDYFGDIMWGRTPIHRAILSVDQELLAEAIAAGESLDSEDGSGWSPARYAVHYNKMDALEMLLVNGLDPNGDRINLFELAISSNNLRACQLLWRHGAASESVGPDSMMRLGIMSTNEAVFQAFLEEDDVDPNQLVDAMPALHYAITKGRINQARMLMSNGADVNQKIKSTGQLALHLAIQLGEPSLIRDLLACGADPFAISKMQPVPLLYAMKHYKETRAAFLDAIHVIPQRIFQVLIREIEDEYTSLINHGSPAQYQEQAQSLARFWFELIQKGLPYSNEFSIANPLNLAAIFGLSDFAQELLDKYNLDPNSLNMRGLNSLDYAIKYQQHDMVSLLQSYGVKKQRPTVLVITDCSFEGQMYQHAISELDGFEVEQMNACADYRDIDGDQLIREIKTYLAGLPEGANRAQAILNSDIAVVHRIKQDAKRMLSLADGVWISGGADVCRIWYDPDTKGLKCDDLLRDLFEIAILDLQQKSEYKPLIGVCRGNQMINVFHGGTLQNKGEVNVNPLIVQTSEGFLGNGLPKKAAGWSLHHQSIDKLGKNLQVVATSTTGMVKGIQSPNPGLPIMGTQFHPEMGSSDDASQKTSSGVFSQYLNAVKASKDETCVAEFRKQEKKRKHRGMR
ncbi:MAG: ankyrin repeat domain-containing protein [Candidatus Berkiellales bacterium]